MPLVSVLLPVFNAAATLDAAVESIVAQTCADWELVAVDDGSTDGSRECLASWARRDPRIRVVPGAHLGLVAALERGLAVAQGRLVARMDADDVSHPERLAAQVAWLDEGTQGRLDVVSCLVEFGGDRLAQPGYAGHVDWLNTVVEPEVIAAQRFVESPVAHPSVLFRRDLIERHGGYRAGAFPEDYELWLRWLDAGVRFGKVPRTLLTWRDGPERLSRTDARYAEEAFYALKAEWLAREVIRRARGRAVWIWGAGRPTRKRARLLTERGIEISGYIDIDPRKSGRPLGGTGLPVIAPEAVGDPVDVMILGYVAVRGARAFQREFLRARGFREGEDVLFCA